MLRSKIAEQRNSTDRERVLHTILTSLMQAATLYSKPPFEMAHIDAYADPQVGDLVIGMMGEVGWLLDIESPDAESHERNYRIRPIGRSEPVLWSNERFFSIRGINLGHLLEGEQHQFFRMAELAMLNHPEHSGIHIFESVSYEDDAAIVTSRKKWTQSTTNFVINGWREYLEQPNKFLEEIIRQGWGQDAGQD